jgi:hypothetical protein
VAAELRGQGTGSHRRGLQHQLPRSSSRILPKPQALNTAR